jgi:glycosyltransferase involved in cell wall biosynthesis
VLDEATALIVHSRYVEGRAREAGYEGPISVVPHPAWPAPEVEPAELGEGPLIGCLGHINPEKRIPQLLEAFAVVRETVPQARLLLAGPVAARFELDSRLERLGLPEGALIREGYVDERRFDSLMAACDVCVNLRAPTMGETSGSAIRALSLGRPLVVSDVGWFSELPDSVAAKIAPDEREVDVLAGVLVELCTNEDARAQMGRAARELAAGEHAVGRVADLYAAALEQAAGGAAVRDAVLAEIALAAADSGIEPGTPAAAELGVRLREAGLGD